MTGTVEQISIVTSPHSQLHHNNSSEEFQYWRVSALIQTKMLDFSDDFNPVEMVSSSDQSKKVKIQAELSIEAFNWKSKLID